MTTPKKSEVVMHDIRHDRNEESLLDAVKKGLAAKTPQLPTMLLYDEEGLKLFEKISYLDEYYLTNAEIDVLQTYADNIVQHIPNGARLIELGSGNLRKVEILLSAIERARKFVDYYALDLSKPELVRTFAELDTSNYRFVSFNAFHGTYDDGLDWLSRPENQDRPNCVMHLGSSIGNFGRADAVGFLGAFGKVLRSADLLLVGLDGTSDGQRIFNAYNDSKGVTEQFYRNGLEHANRLFGQNIFKQDQWAVEGEYKSEEHKHEASLVALVDIQNEYFTIRKGSKIHLEDAFKYTVGQADTLWHQAGLIPRATFSDKTGQYGLHLLKPAHVDFATDPSSYAATPVPSIQEWQQLWSSWDIVTRSMVPRDELMNKPIQLRNNLIFYLGHIPTFADIHFTRATATKPTSPAYFYQIFERGIDPDVENPELCHDHSEIPDEWPPLADILAYQISVRNRIIKSIESGQAESDLKLARGLWLAYEHEAMHLETFLYMLLQSDRILPPPGQARPDFAALAQTAYEARTSNKWHQIPAQTLTIGSDDPENNLPPRRYFLWDNERPARKVEVGKFEAQSRPISNGDYLEFMRQTGKSTLPASWVTVGDAPEENQATEAFAMPSANGKALRTVYGLLPLKYALDWPVMASYDELAAFAKWSNGRIPTNEELQSIYDYVVERKNLAENTSSTLVPAVNGHLSNEGVQETPPQKHSLSESGEGAGRNVSTLDPNENFINLDGGNVGFKFWTPTAVTGNAGQLTGRGQVGGLWEWTSTSLFAHQGFKAMDLYPGYTADFFDDKHKICLGGSWATVPRIAGRKSFVNWYQHNYPYVWCTARLVRDSA